jgi:hypothetical protein
MPADVPAEYVEAYTTMYRDVGNFMLETREAYLAAYNGTADFNEV